MKNVLFFKIWKMLDLFKTEMNTMDEHSLHGGGGLHDGLEEWKESNDRQLRFGDGAGSSAEEKV